MKTYIKPECKEISMVIPSVLDMSVTDSEYDNDQSLGKRVDTAGLEIVYDEDVWNNFWFGGGNIEEEKSIASLPTTL